MCKLCSSFVCFFLFNMHFKCTDDLRTNKSMTLEQKNTCIMCRAKQVALGSKECIERLRGWVKKGKAWAITALGDRYREGVGAKVAEGVTCSTNGCTLESLGCYDSNGFYYLRCESKSISGPVHITNLHTRMKTLYSASDHMPRYLTRVSTCDPW